MVDGSLESVDGWLGEVVVEVVVKPMVDVVVAAVVGVVVVRLVEDEDVDDDVVVLGTVMVGPTCLGRRGRRGGGVGSSDGVDGGSLNVGSVVVGIAVVGRVVLVVACAVVGVGRVVLVVGCAVVVVGRVVVVVAAAVVVVVVGSLVVVVTGSVVVVAGSVVVVETSIVDVTVVGDGSQIGQSSQGGHGMAAPAADGHRSAPRNSAAPVSHRIMVLLMPSVVSRSGSRPDHGARICSMSGSVNGSDSARVTVIACYCCAAGCP